jgi:hypothetical protein
VQVAGVGHHAHPRPGRKRAQALQSCGHLHDVVRRDSQTTAAFLDDPILPAQQRSPPTRPGIALAGPVGPDEHLTRGGMWKVAGQ